jgi:Protein of unknown function (DUF1570)
MPAQQPQPRFRAGSDATSSQLSRRSWLAAAAGLCGIPAWPQSLTARQAQPQPGQAAEIAEVEALAKQVGLGPFIHVAKGHFLGLGDAPKEFCEAALGICESETTAFLAYFNDNKRGFKLALPQRAMTVITLKDKSSYQAFSGDDPGANVGGHYDIKTNRLVMFDFRSRRAELGANPELINRIALVHETAHLLSYNTGLLSREADNPDWVSEGLAIYCELWQRGKPKRQIGSINGPWLVELRKAKQPGARWLPIHDLIVDDEAIWADDTQTLAYAESWLLVHYLIKNEPEKFRTYVAGLKAATQDTNRVERFEAIFGPTKTVGEHVDRSLKRLQ